MGRTGDGPGASVPAMPYFVMVRRACPRDRSRRSWGWHRLHDEWARRVVAHSPVRAGDLVLDLGAGRGALTGALVGAGARVLAVELNAGRADG